MYNFNGIILPCPTDIRDRYLLSRTYSDQLHIHCKYHGDYTKIDFDKYSKAASEGPICFPIYKSAVMVVPGDIVIDAGAWIGDFSAYAAYCGGICHAFEPLSLNLEMLKKTAQYAEKYTGEIIPVKSALSAQKGTAFFTIDSTSSALTNDDSDASEKISVTTIDEYVRDNNLPRVDFIKADIEGAERDMLSGARLVLREYAPKLSICTYHLPDDPIVLKEIIMQANPNYVVVQKLNKLYAYVPN